MTIGASFSNQNWSQGTAKSNVYVKQHNKLSDLPFHVQMYTILVNTEMSSVQQYSASTLLCSVFACLCLLQMKILMELAKPETASGYGKPLSIFQNENFRLRLAPPPPMELG